MPKLLDGGVVEVAAIDERLHFLQKTIAQISISGHRPRLDQGSTLPALPPAFVIQHGRVHRLHQRSIHTQRSKPQVDTEDKAIFGYFSHGLNDFLADVSEERSRLSLALWSAGTLAFVILKEKNDIDI